MLPEMRRRLCSLLVLICVGWLGVPAATAVCLADGQVAVSLNLSQGICQASPPHISNAFCCSGKASPVWNPSTAKCDSTCDPTDHCIGVVCKARDACHAIGTCDSRTGLCSNPVKPDDTACDDGNSCTVNDGCLAGVCAPGDASPSCCGNGTLDPGEQCDDGNQSGSPLDGCSVGCTIDDKWECSGAPSTCCPGDGAFRFAVDDLTQSECERIVDSDDDVCCDRSHKGVWTGATCNTVCVRNLCRRLDVVCRAKDACHVAGVCAPATGICTDPPQFAGTACGDGTVTPCSAADTCDGQGNCVSHDTPDGQSCDDGSVCTTSDQCVSGTCTGTPTECTSSGVCHVAACDAVTGCYSPPAPAGTPCGASGTCTNRCDSAGNCLPCTAVTTTTTTVSGVTTTTLPACDSLTGLERARCLIVTALAGELCDGEPIPAKLDRALRRRLTVALTRLDAAAESDGRKRTRLLKRVRGALTTVDRKAAAALKAKRPEKRISPTCGGKIAGLVGVTKADLF